MGGESNFYDILACYASSTMDLMGGRGMLWYQSERIEYVGNMVALEEYDHVGERGRERGEA